MKHIIIGNYKLINYNRNNAVLYHMCKQLGQIVRDSECTTCYTRVPENILTLVKLYALDKRLILNKSTFK
jgi:hypothetical protein